MTIERIEKADMTCHTYDSFGRALAQSILHSAQDVVQKGSKGPVVEVAVKAEVREIAGLIHVRVSVPFGHICVSVG
jgi:hypothetical protein